MEQLFDDFLMDHDPFDQEGDLLALAEAGETLDPHHGVRRGSDFFVRRCFSAFALDLDLSPLCFSFGMAEARPSRSWNPFLTTTTS